MFFVRYFRLVTLTFTAMFIATTVAMAVPVPRDDDGSGDLLDLTSHLSLGSGQDLSHASSSLVVQEPDRPKLSLSRRAASPVSGSGSANEPEPPKMNSNPNDPAAGAGAPPKSGNNVPMFSPGPNQEWENPASRPDFGRRQQKLERLVREHDERDRRYGQIPEEPHVQMPLAEGERLRLMHRRFVEQCLAENPGMDFPECVIEARSRLKKVLYAEAWQREMLRQVPAGSFTRIRNQQQQQQQQQQDAPSQDQNPGLNQFSLPAIENHISSGYQALTGEGVKAADQMSRHVKNINWAAVAASLPRGVVQRGGVGVGVPRMATFGV